MSVFQQAFGGQTVIVLPAVVDVDGHGAPRRTWQRPGWELRGVDIQPAAAEEYTLHREGLNWQHTLYMDASQGLPGPDDHVVWEGREYRQTQPAKLFRGFAGMPDGAVLRLSRWEG